jgi:hypothetical protein
MMLRLVATRCDRPVSGFDSEAESGDSPTQSESEAEMPPPLHRHGGDRHSPTLPTASDHDSESRDGPQTDTSVRLGVASTMKHALAGTSIEAQARNSPIRVRVMQTASGPSEVCAVR